MNFQNHRGWNTTIKDITFRLWRLIVITTWNQPAEHGELFVFRKRRCSNVGVSLKRIGNGHTLYYQYWRVRMTVVDPHPLLQRHSQSAADKGRIRENNWRSRTYRQLKLINHHEDFEMVEACGSGKYQMKRFYLPKFAVLYTTQFFK